MRKKKYTALLEWLKDASDEAVERTGTTRAYLRQIAYGNKEASPLIAASLERETNQLITRRELRPDDWELIWPELAGQPLVAPTPKRQVSAENNRRAPRKPTDRRGRRETDLSTQEAKELLESAEKLAGALQRIAKD
jgi:DNA-binding transcriptional regulator YdaS (Cro superfamily)